jgi:hypothetical protein
MSQRQIAGPVVAVTGGGRGIGVPREAVYAGTTPDQRAAYERRI